MMLKKQSSFASIPFSTVLLSKNVNQFSQIMLSSTQSFSETFALRAKVAVRSTLVRGVPQNVTQSTSTPGSPFRGQGERFPYGNINQRPTITSHNNLELPFFFDRCFDKNRIKTFISWLLANFGENATVYIVEKLKNLGFYFATEAGISLSIDDLQVPLSKNWFLSQAEKDIRRNHNNFQCGNLTPVEQSQQLLDRWHQTSEVLRESVIQSFRLTNTLNPVYMMAFSGARGNISQVRQLVGMRGLMADPQGQIISFPIRSNFREGLTLTEYVISCYGARKGVVDTALRTADSGYLTRRLVDVSQHVVVWTFDCKTEAGIHLTEMKEGKKTILSLKKRILGRVLAQEIPTIAFRNQQISAQLAQQIASLREHVLVRSPLSCSVPNSVCQLCYGWSLSRGRIVSLGEAVGVIAAQSIGEPGTQLTMRTFHTGGVFSGDVIDEIRAPHDGLVHFLQPLLGQLIRTSHGKIAYLTRASGSFLIENNLTERKAEHFTDPSTFDRNERGDDFSQGEKDTFSHKQNAKDLIPQKVRQEPIGKEPLIKKDSVLVVSNQHFASQHVNQTLINLEPGTALFVRQGEKVIAKQLLAEYSSISTQTKERVEAQHQVYSDQKGEIFFDDVLLGKKLKKEEPELEKESVLNLQNKFKHDVSQESEAYSEDSDPQNVTSAASTALLGVSERTSFSQSLSSPEGRTKISEGNPNGRNEKDRTKNHFDREHFPEQNIQKIDPQSGRKIDIVTSLKLNTLWVLSGTLFEPPIFSPLYTKIGDLVDKTTLLTLIQNELNLQTPHLDGEYVVSTQLKKNKTTKRKEKLLTFFRKNLVLNKLPKILQRENLEGSRRKRNSIFLSESSLNLTITNVKYKKSGYFFTNSKKERSYNFYSLFLQLGSVDLFNNLINFKNYKENSKDDSQHFAKQNRTVSTKMDFAPFWGTPDNGGGSKDWNLIFGKEKTNFPSGIFLQGKKIENSVIKQEYHFFVRKEIKFIFVLAEPKQIKTFLLKSNDEEATFFVSQSNQLKINSSEAVNQNVYFFQKETDILQLFAANKIIKTQFILGKLKKEAALFFNFLKENSLSINPFGKQDFRVFVPKYSKESAKARDLWWRSYNLRTPYKPSIKDKLFIESWLAAIAPEAPWFKRKINLLNLSEKRKVLKKYRSFLTENLVFTSHFATQNTQKLKENKKNGNSFFTTTSLNQPFSNYKEFKNEFVLQWFSPYFKTETGGLIYTANYYCNKRSSETHIFLIAEENYGKKNIGKMSFGRRKKSFNIVSLRELMAPTICLTNLLLSGKRKPSSSFKNFLTPLSEDFGNILCINRRIEDKYKIKELLLPCDSNITHKSHNVGPLSGVVGVNGSAKPNKESKKKKPYNNFIEPNLFSSASSFSQSEKDCTKIDFVPNGGNKKQPKGTFVRNSKAISINSLLNETFFLQNEGLKKELFFLRKKENFSPYSVCFHSTKTETFNATVNFLRKGFLSFKKKWIETDIPLGYQKNLQGSQIPFYSTENGVLKNNLTPSFFTNQYSNYWAKKKSKKLSGSFLKDFFSLTFKYPLPHIKVKKRPLSGADLDTKKVCLIDNFYLSKNKFLGRNNILIKNFNKKPINEKLYQKEFWLTNQERKILKATDFCSANHGGSLSFPYGKTKISEGNPFSQSETVNGGNGNTIARGHEKEIISESSLSFNQVKTQFSQFLPSKTHFAEQNVQKYSFLCSKQKRRFYLAPLLTKSHLSLGKNKVLKFNPFPSKGNYSSSAFIFRINMRAISFSDLQKQSSLFYNPYPYSQPLFLEFLQNKSVTNFHYLTKSLKTDLDLQDKHIVLQSKTLFSERSLLGFDEAETKLPQSVDFQETKPSERFILQAENSNHLTGVKVNLQNKYKGDSFALHSTEQHVEKEKQENSLENLKVVKDYKFPPNSITCNNSQNKGENLVFVKQKLRHRNKKFNKFSSFLQKQINKFSTKKYKKTVEKLQRINLQIRSGWLYLPKDQFQTAKAHQSFIPPFQQNIDEILFDQFPVYTESILRKNFEEQLVDKYLQPSTNVVDFYKTKTLLEKSQLQKFINQISTVSKKSKQSVKGLKVSKERSNKFLLSLRETFWRGSTFSSFVENDFTTSHYNNKNISRLDEKNNLYETNLSTNFLKHLKISSRSSFLSFLLRNKKDRKNDKFIFLQPVLINPVKIIFQVVTNKFCRFNSIQSFALSCINHVNFDFSEDFFSQSEIIEKNLNQENTCIENKVNPGLSLCLPQISRIYFVKNKPFSDFILVSRRLNFHSVKTKSYIFKEQDTTEKLTLSEKNKNLICNGTQTIISINSISKILSFGQIKNKVSNKLKNLSKILQNKAFLIESFSTKVDTDYSSFLILIPNSVKDKKSANIITTILSSPEGRTKFSEGKPEYSIETSNFQKKKPSFYEFFREKSKLWLLIRKVAEYPLLETSIFQQKIKLYKENQTFFEKELIYSSTPLSLYLSNRITFSSKFNKQKKKEVYLSFYHSPKVGLKIRESLFYLFDTFSKLEKQDFTNLSTDLTKNGFATFYETKCKNKLKFSDFNLPFEEWRPHTKIKEEKLKLPLNLFPCQKMFWQIFDLYHQNVQKNKFFEGKQIRFIKKILDTEKKNLLKNKISSLSFTGESDSPSLSFPEGRTKISVGNLNGRSEKDQSQFFYKVTVENRIWFFQKENLENILFSKEKEQTIIRSFKQSYLLYFFLNFNISKQSPLQRIEIKTTFKKTEGSLQTSSCAHYLDSQRIQTSQNFLNYLSFNEVKTKISQGNPNIKINNLNLQNKKTKYLQKHQEQPKFSAFSWLNINKIDLVKQNIFLPLKNQSLAEKLRTLSRKDLSSNFSHKIEKDLLGKTFPFTEQSTLRDQVFRQNFQHFTPFGGKRQTIKQSLPLPLEGAKGEDQTIFDKIKPKFFSEKSKFSGHSFTPFARDLSLTLSFIAKLNQSWFFSLTNDTENERKAFESFTFQSQKFRKRALISASETQLNDKDRKQEYLKDKKSISKESISYPLKEKSSYTTLLLDQTITTHDKTPVARTAIMSKEEGEIENLKNKSASLILKNSDIEILLTKNEKPLLVVGQLIRYGEQIANGIAAPKSGQIIQVDNNRVTLRKAQPILFPRGGSVNVNHGDYVKEGSPLLSLSYQRLVTGDIVQGIPKIEQLFEARETEGGQPLLSSLHSELEAIFLSYSTQLGLKLAVRESFKEIQQIIVDRVQRVYIAQGVLIADKHFEVVIRQMTSKVRILDGGRPGFLYGELVDLRRVELLNAGVPFVNEQAIYEPIILGISKACLEAEGFLSPASFQETTRVLSLAAIERKTDFLRGIKERVILGDVIQAGTGFALYDRPIRKIKQEECMDLSLSVLHNAHSILSTNQYYKQL